MFNSFLFYVVVAGTLVAAQLMPDCGTSCRQSSDLGGCQATDNACLCKSTTFTSSFNSCIQSTCNPVDLIAAIAVSNAQCLQVGISLSLPGSSTSTSQSTTNSQSTTESTTGSSTSGPSSTGPSSTGPGTPTSTKPSGTTKSSDGHSGSSTASPTTSPSNHKVPIGAIVGGVAGGLVLIALLVFLCTFRRRRRLRRLEKSAADYVVDFDSSTHIYPTPNVNTGTVAGSVSGTETSYPTSWQGHDAASSRDHVPANFAAIPVPSRLSQASGPQREDPRLRDEVEQLRREVQRLQQSTQPGSPSPAAQAQLSVAEMKQLQSQAVRNIYGHSDPADLPPTYEAAGR